MFFARPLAATSDEKAAAAMIASATMGDNAVQ
jgi:hypothetical protein